MGAIQGLKLAQRIDFARIMSPQGNHLKRRLIERSGEMVGDEMAQVVRPPPLGFPCLGLGNLAVSQPSCFLRVAWQLGTGRVLQLNAFFLSITKLCQILACGISLDPSYDWRMTLGNITYCILVLLFQANAAFRIYAPPLSEEFITFLNDLLSNGPPDESDIHSPSCSVDELDNVLDWKRLIRLPEICLLQGFKPLQIPTQQRLCETESQAPLFPFNMDWLHARNSVKPLQTDADQPNANVLHYFRLTSSQQIIHERIEFILKSARDYSKGTAIKLEKIYSLKNRLTVALLRCLASVPLEGSTRDGILSGRPSLDRGSRDTEFGFEPRTFRSLNSRSNKLSDLAGTLVAITIFVNRTAVQRTFFCVELPFIYLLFTSLSCGLSSSHRIIAREYPALLGWIDGDSGPLNSSFPNGLFRTVARKPPVLAELIIPSHVSQQPSSDDTPLDENNLTIMHRTEANSSTGNQTLFNHHAVPLQIEIQPNDNTTNTSDQRVLTEQSLPVQRSTNAASDASSEPTAHVDQIAGERNLHSGMAITPRSPNEPVEWRATPANSIEQISSRTADAARSTSTTTTSGSASGGLIVNAELAKFIQEQASQVAARQQRAELSSLSPNINGDHPDAANRAPSTNNDGSTVHRTGKANQTRLCLSAAFRRDLPPRFARRLQAELLEREAQEQRLGTNVESSDKLNREFTDRNVRGSNPTSTSPLPLSRIGHPGSGIPALVKPSGCMAVRHRKSAPAERFFRDWVSLTSSVAMLNLDQPAPLARKESEAPFELNSLLSTTGDPVASDELITISPAVNSIEAGIFSSGSLQPAHVLHARQLTTSSTPFLTPVQNASLDVSPRSYVAPPLSMYPTPPMPLPFSRSHMIPDFQTAPPTAPPAPPVFGSQIPPRSSLYDWHPPNRVFDPVNTAPVSFALPYTSTVIPAQPVHSTMSNPLLPISDHLPPLDLDNIGEGVGFPGQYRLRSLGQSAEYNSATVNTDAARFVQHSLLLNSSATSTKGFAYPTEGLLESSVLHPAAVVTSTEQEQCLNFPPLSCHTKEARELGSARSPKPRQGKSNGRGRVRTTDLPVSKFAL
ncbi:hypothetical protein T265_03685 [Opisthorchis viverrini]|uniref:Uncharacterized protein n=1 Tax=Opisthorchis viverrini TaxID=6198 RepID=A0A075A2K6_OPIVI|nr:hypothetical protein T265_03685 [Opisthorchis viverrini]KER29775.1 hypothetical protein T265_03685 [Opisthorchis viverrini]